MRKFGIRLLGVMTVVIAIAAVLAGASLAAGEPNNGMACCHGIGHMACCVAQGLQMAVTCCHKFFQ